ncbi:hypothetical protein ACFW1A_15535 [Kitasatospora sp. NPDC058965]|uniref:hypothetical protein n=1 Tax=Kitasatospora sp. NPDC058965 TaxID=3346682 RepID=UPI00367EED28
MPDTWESGARWLGRAVLRHLIALGAAVVGCASLLVLANDPPPGVYAVEGVVWSVVLLGLLLAVVIALPTVVLLALLSPARRSDRLRPLGVLVVAGPALLFAVPQPQEWVSWLPAVFQSVYVLLLLPEPRRLNAGPAACVPTGEAAR